VGQSGQEGVLLLPGWGHPVELQTCSILFEQKKVEKSS
jgi:hypothetical protein